MLNQSHQFHSPWIHLNQSVQAFRHILWRAVLITLALLPAGVLLAISASRVASA